MNIPNRISSTASWAVLAPVGLALAVSLSTANARDQRPPRDGGDPQRDGRIAEPRQRDAGGESAVSPALRIDRQSHHGDHHNRPAPDGFRNIDGSGNNEAFPQRGAAHINLLRLVPADYSDGVSSISGSDRPSARAISNTVSAQQGTVLNGRNASDFLWQWGQFIDHDIDLTDGTEPPEPAPIAVPSGDAWFDPDATSTATISLNRSIYDTDSGTGSGNPRQQLNEITAWIDASNVYGSDTERADALRTNDGTGRLKTSAGDLLPFNTEGLPNAGGDSASLFLAGDVRANEQLGLTTMHTLFMREHNRLAADIAQRHPEFDGEQIYQHARRIVGAQMQVITYKEYLPVLLGPDLMRPYRGYRPEVDGSIRNLFSGASYRYGHSALSPTLLRLEADGSVISDGNLPLRNAFFAPYRLASEGGLEPMLRGLATQVCQDIDPLVIDDVRNFLFGEPGQGGFDLVSLNIQRGRDHGLPSYNDARSALGLTPAATFADISSDPEMQQRLAAAYGSVDQVDVWVGGLAEDHLPGALVGELIGLVLATQFEALRDGDRFWYQNSLEGEELRRIEDTRLSDIIRRNTNIGAELQRDVFVVSQ